MNAGFVTELIGIIASVLTGISLLPQFIKLLKEKNAGGLSPMMLSVLFAGLLLWAIYGWQKKDYIILIANLFAWTINLCVFFLYFRYRKKNKT